MPEIKRPNYFTSEFLVAKDFQDEQAYHRDMRHCHNRLLHTPGVVNGLEVKTDDNKLFIVKAGMAIDQNGKEIILASDTLPQPLNLTATGGIYVTIEYKDVTDEQDKDVTSGLLNQYRRITERPLIKTTTSQPTSNDVVILLAKVNLAINGNIINIEDMRTFASAKINNATLNSIVKKAGDTMTGPLTVNANLQVTKGAIIPSVGNTEASGIMFPKDPGGGTGDAAWLRYYSRTGENTTFEIGTSNNSDDHIALMASGNVGIGTTDPKYKLEVVGDIKASSIDSVKLNVFGDLYVDGNIQVKDDTLAAMILRKRQYHGIVDIDPNMPLIIHLCFESRLHIPKTIKLFLRGSLFSRAFYTELGSHTHQAAAQSISLNHSHGHNFSISSISDHTHAINVGNTGGAGKPSDHNYGGSFPSSLGGWKSGWISLLTCLTGETAAYWVSSSGSHNHSLSGGIVSNLGDHQHSITVSSTGASIQAGTQSKEYFSSLQLLVNGQPRTDSLLQLLNGWREIGNGSATHPLITSGTGVLDITSLVPQEIGNHELRFVVTQGGGKLQYNIFCE
ncbi:hypothetical protein [Anabaena azotica]|uniref:Uncharacterized protein n=1 Tax=Anabaena azotica FACHB-119 TaxID=947527 RepID=A0ABR8DDJ5_9NOST|nr:hypothetical protein [Anabaena azotica]MBD2503798.1 hypothetical protein [Anabaena azotica FACHB-119]